MIYVVAGLIALLVVLAVEPILAGMASDAIDKDFRWDGQQWVADRRKIVTGR